MNVKQNKKRLAQLRIHLFQSQIMDAMFKILETNITLTDKLIDTIQGDILIKYREEQKSITKIQKGNK